MDHREKSAAVCQEKAFLSEKARALNIPGEKRDFTGTVEKNG